MPPSPFIIIFYDGLGRVVGLESRDDDHDYECWEYARAKISDVAEASAFAVWRGDELVCAEGDGAIEAVNLLVHKKPPRESSQPD